MTLSACSGTVLGKQCFVAAPLEDWETFTGPDVFMDIYTHLLPARLVHKKKQKKGGVGSQGSLGPLLAYPHTYRTKIKLN